MQLKISAASLMFAVSVAWAEPPVVPIATQIPGLGPTSPIYTFTDEDGNAVTPKTWVGKPAIFAAAYTTCPTTCSFTFKNLKKLQSVLPKNASATPVFVVSIDPEHDTPAVLKAFKAKEKVDWHFLTGNENVTRKFLENFNISFGQKSVADNHIMHPNAIVLLNAEGKPVADASGVSPDFKKILAFFEPPKPRQPRAPRPKK
ncbi:MAG: SCO family protein [Bdellovibrionia bacterium]